MMKLIIISGLSGSGKSIALDTLEDCGYYCIDNLPLALLESFVYNVMLNDKQTYAKTAIGIDARNQHQDLARFAQCLARIRMQNMTCEIIFMRAQEASLIKRYSETRRRHPLSHGDISLKEALQIEQDRLNQVAQHATMIIDTSHTDYHQLRDLIKERIGIKNTQSISLLFQSFGFKYGVPLDVDFMFDARCLPNPYWVDELRGLTGHDNQVISFLEQQLIVVEFLQGISTFLHQWIPRFTLQGRTYLTVAVGCTGGQHRSVYLIEQLAKQFSQHDTQLMIRHRELS